MQLERLGVIVLFGIVVPGAYLTVFILLAFASILELQGIPGHLEILTLLGKHVLFSSTAFFFISYLFGVVLRLFAPSVIEKLCGWYLKVIRRKKDRWLQAVFPYKESLAEWLEEVGMKKVPDFIITLNEQYGYENNTPFFNYCKMLIEAHNESLADRLRQNEAFIRFLSGTSLALLISLVISLCLSGSFLIVHHWSFFQVYVVLTLISFITLLGILERFKHQRYREVITVWQGTYLLLKGGIPNKLNIEPEELTHRVMMEEALNPKSP